MSERKPDQLIDAVVRAAYALRHLAGEVEVAMCEQDEVPEDLQEMWDSLTTACDAFDQAGEAIGFDPNEWDFSENPPVQLDTHSSVSRQHYIDTGRYLPEILDSRPQDLAEREDQNYREAVRNGAESYTGYDPEGYEVDMETDTREPA